MSLDKVLQRSHPGRLLKRCELGLSQVQRVLGCRVGVFVRG